MARLKNTLIFSKKAYQEDKEFAKSVLETASIARNKSHHIKLLQKIYPSYIIKELFTYDHSCLIIEENRRCQFDSSADAFAAYKCEKQLQKRLQEINDDLADYQDFDEREGYGYFCGSDEE
jgi:hypothetical protein